MSQVTSVRKIVELKFIVLFDDSLAFTHDQKCLHSFEISRMRAFSNTNKNHWFEIV